MRNDLGNQLVTRQSRKSKVLLYRIIAVVAFVGFTVGGFYSILSPTEHSILALVAFGLAILLGGVSYMLSRPSQVIIFEEGVVVKKSSKAYQFHFSEIKGLRDESNSRTTYIPLGLGLIGGIAAGVVQAAAGAVADSSNRRNRIREINIVIDGNEISVVDTGGDELSQAYTEWLIKNKHITPESLPTLDLFFGDSIQYSKGIFTCSPLLKSETNFALADVTEIDVRGDQLMFFALNEKGKQQCIAEIGLLFTANTDLLFIVYEMWLSRKTQS